MTLGYFYMFTHNSSEIGKVKAKMGFLTEDMLKKTLKKYKAKNIFFIIESKDIYEFSKSLCEKLTCYFPITNTQELKMLVIFLKNYFDENGYTNIIFKEEYINNFKKSSSDFLKLFTYF